MDRERALLDELRDALSLLDKEREKFEVLWESSGKAIAGMRERNVRLEKALRGLVKRCQIEDVPWAEEIDARIALKLDGQN